MVSSHCHVCIERNLSEMFALLLTIPMKLGYLLLPLGGEVLFSRDLTPAVTPCR